MYDLIVVGAGPAGSFAAFKSATSGLKTLLIEREMLPRDKPCGGVVDGKTLSNLDKGVFDIVEAKGSSKEVLYNYHRIRTLDCEEYFFKRDRFDYFITKMAMDAGSEVIDSCPVTGVAAGPEGVAVQTPHMEHRGKMLIGADGVYSLVGGSAGLTHDHKMKYAAIVADMKMDYSNLLGTGDYSQMHFFEDLIGFAWMIPNRDSLNVGMGATMRKSSGLRRKFDTFCKKIGIRTPKVLGHMIPYTVLDKFQAGRILLVGDAAGFVNPWTGGGIATGIYSAQMAVETCLDMISSDDFTEEASQAYPRRCRSVIRNLKFRTRLIRVLDETTPADFELPVIAEPVVRRLCGMASLRL